MGGWDYYCFLCYAGFFNPEDEEDEPVSDEDGTKTQREPDLKKLFPRADVSRRLDWLSDFRTIGVNRKATGVKQCYLSGRASVEEYGRAVIELGDHPNALSLDLSSTNGEVTCYRHGSQEDGDLPVHESCLTVLCEAFAQARGIKTRWTAACPSTTLPFDLDTLFACLAPARQDYGSCLNLGHELQTEQYFFIEWDDVYYYFDPLDSRHITPKTEQNIKRENSHAQHSAVGGANGPQGRTVDCFSRLPEELVRATLLYVPAEDLGSLLLSSRRIYEVTESNSFWSERMRIDAPWYWEKAEVLSSTADHEKHREYIDVMMQALRPVEVAKRGGLVSGLANRQRIWQVSQEVVRLYELISPLAAESSTTESSVFEEGAVCRYFPRVADQASTAFKADTVFFSTVPDQHLSKSIELYWSNAGALCGLSISVGGSTSVCGDCSASAGTKDTLALPDDDWLEKLVLDVSSSPKTYEQNGVTRTKYDHFVSGITCYTLSGEQHQFGRTDGNKRLLEPLQGKGIVGLRTELADGIITRFGILEHVDGLTKHRAANDQKRLDLLWRGNLPPQHLRFSDFQTGYWSFDTVWDLAPMEQLMFGTTEMELATVTGFGASTDCRCFEVYRNDGSKQRIGTAGGPMKVMRIDGPGGERIGGFRLVVGALPVGITIITTRGRQSTFGKSRDNTSSVYRPDHGFGVAGIYCSFEYDSTPSRQMSSLSLIQSPDIGAPGADPRVHLDESGLAWEPRPPSPSWHDSGPVYGMKHPRGAVVVALDFSRPVTRIQGLLPAPEWLSIIELGGWTIDFGDDCHLEQSSTFGMTSEVWPNHPNATAEEFQAMKRFDRMAMGGREVDSVPPLAHVRTDAEALAQPRTWELSPGDERLTSVTVWAGDYLHGIQFHSESGKSSPRWGKCGGQPAAHIRAGGDTELIVGLKVILGTHRLGRTACCDVPLGVQAMSKVL
ncbi:Uu.00g143230.m01.CDS01 [Anthostomella pinea]|uniref:Uu.00g143230.m01.CDS01 n=1 Tax=Anthostomella pinea TaxID=933095 RepID=A0AAI8VRT4_9PEZI|nr:Uu.00g143230.m01.CDS01 [Anthostomella pinea]